MLALLSVPLLMFFQLYSVQKYFAINMELFSKDFVLMTCFYNYSAFYRMFASDILKATQM